MDVVILCGGMGSRLSEETVIKPKPMVEIGGKPILWHIMKYYSSYGFRRFVLALGYKAEYIKQYFYNLRIAHSDFSMTLRPDSEPTFFSHPDEQDWEVTFVDTGLETLKGGRIKRLEQHIQSDSFHLTYGDGLADVPLDQLVDFHREQGRLGTVSAVHPPSRFGEMQLNGDLVSGFEEKPQMSTGYINGGFFIFNRNLLERLSSDVDSDFEFGPLQDMVAAEEVSAFRHDGFFQCMDNVRERDLLNRLIESGKAPWMRWARG